MTEHEFFRKYRRFVIDYERLERWYLATLVSYDYSVDTVNEILEQKRKQRIHKERKKVFFKEEEFGKEYLIQHDYTDLLKKYQKGYRVFLEEMVLIRLVSLLEVLLSDMIISSFYYDKRSFFTKGKYEVNISEFLYKNKEELEREYIEKLVDKHSRGGFLELQKLYDKTLNIKLNSFNKLEKNSFYTYKNMEKLHDTRHLIIHQLGQTDKKYRTKYDYDKKTLQLTEKEIIEYLGLVKEFAFFLEEQLKDKVINQDI